MLFTLRSFEGGGGKGGREYRRDKDSCHWQCLGWPGTDSLDTWLKHLPRGWKNVPGLFRGLVSRTRRFFGNLARLTTCRCASITCSDGYQWYDGTMIARWRMLESTSNFDATTWTLKLWLRDFILGNFVTIISTQKLQFRLLYNPYRR